MSTAAAVTVALSSGSTTAEYRWLPYHCARAAARESHEKITKNEQDYQVHKVRGMQQQKK